MPTLWGEHIEKHTLMCFCLYGWWFVNRFYIHSKIGLIVFSKWICYIWLAAVIWYTTGCYFIFRFFWIFGMQPGVVWDFKLGVSWACSLLWFHISILGVICHAPWCHFIFQFWGLLGHATLCALIFRLAPNGATPMYGPMRTAIVKPYSNKVLGTQPDVIHISTSSKRWYTFVQAYRYCYSNQ